MKANENTNVFGTFRQTIIKTIVDTVVKKSQDNLTTSYNWAIARVFNKCAENCNITDKKNLPAEFKDIVRFEFNKLKELVLSDESVQWEHIRSRMGYVFTQDGVRERKMDTYENPAVPIEKQLEVAVRMFDKIEVQISKATAERAVSLRKRRNRLHKEILFLRETISTQKTVLAEMSQANQAAIAQQVAEVKEIVPQGQPA